MELLQNGTLKPYRDNVPHRMPTTYADVVNAELLAFPRSTGYSADPDSASRWCSFARMSSGV